MAQPVIHTNLQRILQNYSQKPIIKPSGKPTPIKPSPPPPPPIPKGLVKALLIGINYTAVPELQLYGCINDVMNTRIHLQSMYPNCKDVRVLTDMTPVKPTKEAIIESIQWLVKDLKPGQIVYFHFSGHGTLVKDTNGDERSGADSCICPINGTTIDTITDDELRTILVDKIPSGCKCFAVFDCCSSGTALDLRYTWKTNKPGTLSFEQDSAYPKSKGNVLFLSACRDDQYAMDTVDTFGNGIGALTSALLPVWKQYKFNLKLKHLLWDVRQNLKERGYEQIPQISTGTATSSEDLCL